MIDFPNSPTVGDAFVAAGTTYKCTQVSPNVWLGSPASGLGIPDAPNDGVQYGRQSKAWTPIASGGNYVLKTGDTMTGALVINQTASPYNATLTLNKAADANSVNIYGQSGGLSRWTLMLGSGGASDFILQPYADNGVTPNPVPFKIIRATSSVQIGDGTVAAPGLAFISEPGLGLRRAIASDIRFTARGSDVVDINAAGATSYLSVYPVAAAGNAQFTLQNAPQGAVNYNQFFLQNTQTGYFISETLAGTATSQPLTMSFSAGITMNGAGGLTVANKLTISGAAPMALDATVSYSPTLFFSPGGWRLKTDTANGIFQFISNTGQGLISFDSAGQAYKLGAGTSWSNISDQRAKTNVRDYTDGLERVLSLRPRLYDRIDTPDRDAVGCIADEAEIGFPKLITRGPGRVGDVEYDDLATLHMDPLFWALVNAVKTLNAKIEALQ